MLAELGLNTYRFSVEWARIQPSDGTVEPRLSGTTEEWSTPPASSASCPPVVQRY
ncbi:MAG: hypothetical protein ACLQBX_18200 [Candidatus Limnocylindrales bacterium]